MAKDYATENESLRERNNRLMAEIRDRDMAEVRARQEAIEQEAAAAADRDRYAREEAVAAELESRRRAAWLSHRTDEALASGQEAFVQLLNQRDMLSGIPTTAWPPGYEPPTSVPGIPDTPVSTAGGTLLGKLLKEKGIEI